MNFEKLCIYILKIYLENKKKKEAVGEDDVFDDQMGNSIMELYENNRDLNVEKKIKKSDKKDVHVKKSNLIFCFFNFK